MAGSQSDASLAVLSDGTVCVVWAEQNRDGSMDGIFGQLFTPAGVRTGGTSSTRSPTPETRQRGAGPARSSPSAERPSTWGEVGELVAVPAEDVGVVLAAAGDVAAREDGRHVARGEQLLGDRH